MIREGDTVVNPVTGEHITFLETAADTGGERVLIDFTVQPSGFLAAPHAHPFGAAFGRLLGYEASYAARPA